MHRGYVEAVVTQGQKAILALSIALVATRLQAAEHPVALPKDADCASCHEDKTKGKAIHSAIAMGCNTCHEVKTEGETTTVNLTSPKEELCFTCHEKSKDETQHLPYEKGQCVTCHDPHASDYPKQVRAEVNTLCLQCHAVQRPQGDTMMLIGNQSLLVADFRVIPKVVADPAVRVGHPFDKHPMASVADPLRGNETMSCLSCHRPHSSPQEKLIQTTKEGVDLCNSCHQAFEAQKRPPAAGQVSAAGPTDKKGQVPSATEHKQ